MKISAFTFLRNAQRLQFPFVESIRSALPLVDEFVIALGPCDDDTEAMIRAIGDPKIRIIPTAWNENLDGTWKVKGFIYGQQKTIALFNCTGDWALYLEGDELLHIKPGGPLDCSDGQVLHAWCLGGHGIAWRSTWEVANDIASGRLVSLLDEFAAPPNGIYAVFTQRKHLPLRLRLWIDYLKSRYGDPGYWEQ